MSEAVTENWGDSRWEFTKARSKWHFDTSKPAEPGLDSFTYVCHFDGDFTAAIAECMPNAAASSWGSRNNLIKDIAEQGLYSASAEENDLARAGADPKQEVFCRADASEVRLFKLMAGYFGMMDNQIKFHNQRTGQMLHTHIDNFAARPERENSFKVTEMDTNPDSMRRFAVMLADWELGQIFQLGNANFTHWKAGDCITWEWQDIPHATANMGWADRPMLQVTGRVTQRTRDVLANASRDRIVSV